MLEEASNLKKKIFNNIFPRRFGIALNKFNRIHLFGAPKCGKTSVGIYLANLEKNSFYIDFGDIRNDIEIIKNYLFKIQMEKKIELLILDNVPRDWELFPHIKNIITIANTPRNDCKNVHIAALNFAEFLGFDNSNNDTSALLDNFIKIGNLPICLKNNHYLDTKQQILKQNLGRELENFKLISRFSSQKFSINQIYHIAKKSQKTSKDRIYGLINDLEAQKMIYLISHFNRPKLPKKLFLWDFSLKSALGYEKNFNAVFENMVFLELLNENEIFYSDKIHLISQDCGYIIAPFASKEAIIEKLNKIDFLGLKIIIISLGLEDEITIKNQHIRIKNFINFALGE